ncbi:hypothetical protein EZS27_034668 [termite gut metagenome]|uniref:Uncharacterized protein n=1 Tax=termite gut metagenome TaxID=433724 RepID=A0A5J4PYQ9_9ZZZZ
MIISIHRAFIKQKEKRQPVVRKPEDWNPLMINIQDILITVTDNPNGFTDTIKLSFPNNDALKKSVYPAIAEIEKKWYQPVWSWG